MTKPMNRAIHATLRIIICVHLPFPIGVCSSLVAHGACEVPSMKVLSRGKMNECWKMLDL